MTHTRIKICGIRDPQMARVAAEAGAHAVGMVFVERSPRFVNVEQAQHILAALPPMVEPIALFCDATLDEVRRVCDATGLRTIQLHGQESPAFAAALAPCRVIKSLPFSPATAEAAIKPWLHGPANVTAILWDTPPPSTDDLTGGSGQSFDWNDLRRMLSTGLAGSLPVILAGGLNPRNVAAAIEAARPFAVDVSSGVESNRGVKDAALIRAFCAAAQRA